MIEKYPKKSKNGEKYTNIFLSNFSESFLGTDFPQFHKTA
jgi:hypothetical protein